MAATALSTSLEQAIDEIGDLSEQFEGRLGRKVTVSTSSAAATATSTDQAFAILGTSQTFDVLNNWGLWIPTAAAAADQFRVVKLGGFAFNATGGTTTLSFTNTSNYGESLSSVTGYMLMPGVKPADVIAVFNDALEKLHTEAWWFVRHGPESADMLGANVDTDWTESNATDAVQTTAAEVLWGPQSLVVTDSGSGGGYTASAAQRVGQGKAIKLHTFYKADVGTFTVQVLDASSNVQGSIASTSEDWVYGSKRVQFDSGEETFTLRLTGTTASAEGDIAFAGYVKVDQGFFILPSWIDARYKIKALAQAKFHASAAESDTYLAGSIDLIRMRQQSPNDEGHYRFLSHEAAANPYALMLTQQGMQFIEDLLVLVIDHPYSVTPGGASAAFSTVASTNVCPVNELVAMAEYLFGLRYAKALPGVAESGLRKVRERIPARATELPPLPHFGGPRDI
jgi:hypothetical protein